MKNRRIGAAAIVNPPPPPKKKEQKAQKEGREGSNPLIWSPAAVNSRVLKHPLGPVQTEKTKPKNKAKTNAQTLEVWGETRIEYKRRIRVTKQKLKSKTKTGQRSS